MIVMMSIFRQKKVNKAKEKTRIQVRTILCFT